MDELLHHRRIRSRSRSLCRRRPKVDEISIGAADIHFWRRPNANANISHYSVTVITAAATAATTAATAAATTAAAAVVTQFTMTTTR